MNRLSKCILLDTFFKKTILLFFLVGLFPSNLLAQQHESDSILKLLSKPQTDKNRVDLLYRLAYSFGPNNDKYDNYCNEGLKLSKKIDYKSGLAYGYNLKGNYYYCQNKTSDALKMFYKALTMYEELNDKTNILYCYISLGDTYDELSNYQKAFEYNLKGYELSKKKQATKYTCIFSWNLGYILCEMNLPEKSLPYFQVCYETSKKINNEYMNDYLSSAKTGLGIAFYHKKDYKKALSYFYKMQKFKKETFGAPFLIDNYFYLGNTYKAINQIDSSIVNYNKALKFATKYHYLRKKIKICDSLANLYSTIDLVQFTKYNNLAAQLKKIFYNKKQLQDTQLLTFTEQQRQEKLALQEKKQKEQQIQLLLKEKNLAQEKRNLNLYTLISIIILLLLLLTVLYFAYKNKIATANKTKEINELKSRFFTNISHEFRTPLTLIKSPLQSLENTLSDKKQLNQLSLIDKNANRMLELIDQLLAISKIESGELKLILKEGNLGTFLSSIIEPFEFEAKENKINFKYSIEKTLQNHYFDKDCIEKIVTNLLTNAFKYSPDNEPITFTSTVDNESLKLIISNKNNDLKKEDLSKLFDRFYQKNENSKGVGIGLALVKELVSIYNGVLETNIDHHILTFTISLPLEKNLKNSIVVEQTKAIDDENEVTTDETNSDLPILLVAEDNHDIRKVIASLFSDQFKVLEAEDGEQALQLAETEIPDCIISDVMMPKMNGYQLTNTIKTNPITSFIPVVLLTAKSSDESQLEGIKNHADAYITKPFNHEIVKATVMNLINDRKKMHQHYKNGYLLNSTVIEFNNSDKKFIEKVQQIVTQQLSNDEFTADDFAKEIGMSRMQLHRKLKSLIGVSVTELLRNERLKTAAKLFIDNQSIAEVAYAVGFNNISYFSKCFKETYHKTPSEYIDNL